MKKKSHKCHCCDDQMLVETVRRLMSAAAYRGLSRILMPEDRLIRFMQVTKTSKGTYNGKPIAFEVIDWTPDACDFVWTLINGGVPYPSPDFDLKFSERYPWWASDVVMTDVPRLDAARKRANAPKN